MPKAPLQGNCILIQFTPLCVSVIQQTIVSGICIRAMKFNSLAFPHVARWDNSRSSCLSVAMLQQDHIHGWSSKLLRCLFIEMHHKKEACVATNLFTFFWCVDLTWLLSTRGQKIKAVATSMAWQDNLMDMKYNHWLWGGVGYKVGQCACYCEAVREIVLCVSIIMGSESSRQAGAAEKRPPGSEALFCHYQEGRPDNNGDIMRAGDRLSFSKWETVRICGVASQQVHSHWLVPGLS